MDQRLEQAERRNLKRYGFGGKGFALSMIAAGGWGVFVPQELAWGFEHAEPPQGHARFVELPDLEGLPELVLSPS